MRKLEGEQVLMRIFIGESDRWEHRPLHAALLELFRSRGLAGATILRGVAGFGPNSVVHTASILRLSAGLPLVIEVVDKPRRAESRICRGFYHVTGRPTEAPAGGRPDSWVGIPPAWR